MPDPLPVHVSREELHSLEVPPSFETTGSFDVRLINHAEALHIHLHLDDALSEVATLDAGNHYVEGESERYVRVAVDTDRIDGDELLGKLKVASAYGSQTRWVDVTVSKPDPEANTVEVDESLATPQPKTDDTDLSLSPAVPMLGLGALAVVLFAVAALLFDGTVLLVGGVVVVGGVLSALFFLIRDNDPL
ncbi:DUF7524 family protein [Halovenus sp. HT40]|uniref:DUF7524 family protein n=1 Tax=Halovenus sp. HT40 TaxID=3126691 RepID=UPI00300EC042